MAMPATTSAPRPCWGMPASCWWTATVATCAACARRRGGTEERRLLTEVKGLGEVGVDIFFREAQVVWEELFPFVDRRVGQAARRLGLDADPRALAGDRNPEAFARLVAALVRAGLANDHDAVLEAARARSSA